MKEFRYTRYESGKYWAIAQKLLTFFKRPSLLFLFSPQLNYVETYGDAEHEKNILRISDPGLDSDCIPLDSLGGKGKLTMCVHKKGNK